MSSEPLETASSRDAQDDRTAARWSVRRESEPDRLVIELHGRLSLYDSFAAGAALARELSAGPAAVVCDVRGLENYDPLARDMWRDALWPVRGNLKLITYRGHGVLPRLDATMLAAALEVPCEFIDD